MRLLVLEIVSIVLILAGFTGMTSDLPMLLDWLSAASFVFGLTLLNEAQLLGRGL